MLVKIWEIHLVIVFILECLLLYWLRMLNFLFRLQYWLFHLRKSCCQCSFVLLFCYPYFLFRLSLIVRQGTKLLYLFTSKENHSSLSPCLYLLMLEWKKFELKMNLFRSDDSSTFFIVFEIEICQNEEFHFLTHQLKFYKVSTKMSHFYLFLLCLKYMKDPTQIWLH